MSAVVESSQGLDYCQTATNQETPVETGSKLGPYEILEQLGAGGMGEVWLAQDSRLGRKVAIKVLPAEFAADPERLARFEQEARAAAALNHPHIAAVHDVGFENDTHFIVQEWLQGKSLRDAISAGPLPMRKVLALATEIAEGLGAAHRAGIIHRDLKPDNVFVTEDGHAKVLDFGLAKLTEAVAGSLSSQSMSPTVLGTQAGTVMGSAGYMAPEQVRGEEVDRRADLFAFGCVLYEMVSARRAFGGETVLDALHAITRTDPDALSGVVADLPAGLDRIVGKCLQKDAARRYQHADDLAVDLRALAADVEADRAEIVGDPAAARPAGVPAEPRSVSVKMALSAGLLLMTATAALAWTFNPDEPRAVRRLEIALAPGEDLATQFGARRATISPDGEQVVYAANRGSGVRLYRRDLSESAAVEIPGTEGAIEPFFSPDGEWVGFFSGGQMYKLRLDGGVRQLLIDVGQDWEWAIWTDTDEIIFSRLLSGLWSLPAGGGEPTLLAEARTDQNEGGYMMPHAIPGTDNLVFTIWRGPGEVELAALDRATGAVHLLGQAGENPVVTTSGHLVFGLGDQLLAAPFDAGSLALSGSPVPVVQSVRMDLGEGANFSVSNGGTLVYVQDLGQSASYSTLVVVDRAGNIEEEIVEPGVLRLPSFSPDGTRLVVERDSDIWIIELGEEGSRRRWTFDEQNGDPRWHQDGRSIAFVGARRRILMKATGDSLAEVEVLYEAGSFVKFGGWNSEGELIIGKFLDSWDIDAVDDRGETRPIMATGFNERDPETSPDGRWLAYVSDQSGSPEVYLRTTAGAEETQVSDGYGRLPHWSADGTELYYLDSTNQLNAVRLALGEDPRILNRERLFGLTGVGGDYAVHPTEERFLFIDRVATEARAISVVLNWFEELDRLVPTGSGAR